LPAGVANAGRDSRKKKRNRKTGKRKVLIADGEVCWTRGPPPSSFVPPPSQGGTRGRRCANGRDLREEVPSRLIKCVTYGGRQPGPWINFPWSLRRDDHRRVPAACGQGPRRPKLQNLGTRVGFRVFCCPFGRRSCVRARGVGGPAETSPFGGGLGRLSRARGGLLLRAYGGPCRHFRPAR